MNSDAVFFIAVISLLIMVDAVVISSLRDWEYKRNKRKQKERERLRARY